MDGLRHDQVNNTNMPFLDSLSKNGVKALSLKPCFPSKTFPNHYSIITGQYPENHGIISNSFANKENGKKFSLGNEDEVRNAEWYKGEAFWQTAKENGILTASYFWPGSELNLEYRRPHYFMKYNHDTPFKSRVDSVLGWLRLEESKRPRFITLYFHEPDSKSHKYGPNSQEVKIVLQNLDSVLSYFYENLKSLNFFNNINLIFLSDHGMTKVSKEKFLDFEQLIAGLNISYQNLGTFAMVDINNPDETNDIFSRLNEKENNFKVYLKSNVPEHLHFSSNPLISSILLIPENGWQFYEKSRLGGHYIENMSGNHGFDNNHIDMHGTFIAIGSAFKNNYKTGTLNNIDIYPLLCKIFGIYPRSNIDGCINNIGFILK